MQYSITFDEDLPMNFSDKKYWTEFYDKNFNKEKLMNPTPFAEFLLNEKYVVEQDKLIELGCGNGRDAIFFSKHNVYVTAIDQCENTIAMLKKNYLMNAYSLDFTRLDKFSLMFDVIYSRFTFHSISLEGEERLLPWIYSNLASNGKLCVEVRTLRDPIYGKGKNLGNNVWFYNGHHRRFVDAEKFIDKLINYGFKTLFVQEKDGFAKMGDDNNPTVLRAILEK